MQIPSWDPVANGVWRTTIGSTPSLDLLSQSGVAPRVESLAALPEQAFPLLPYICTTFAQHRADGRPLVRAMVLDEDFIAQATAYEQGALDSTENPHNVAPGVDVKDEFVLDRRCWSRLSLPGRWSASSCCRGQLI